MIGCIPHHPRLGKWKKALGVQDQPQTQVCFKIQNRTMTKDPSVCVDAVTGGKPSLQGSGSSVLFFIDNSMWAYMEA